LQGKVSPSCNLARARTEAIDNLAKALRLRGEGRATIRAPIGAAGGAENYVRQMDYQSKLKQNDDVPQFVISAADTPIHPLCRPVERAAKSGQSTA
jgi:hypothetical protein